MKTVFQKKEEHGGILLLLLCITTLITITSLTGYYLLVAGQSHNVARSQSWNSAIPTAEAGVEEAMEHLNYNCVSNYINGGNVNFYADGWTGTNYGAHSGVTKQKQVFGSDPDYSFDVVIWTNDSLHPLIEASGYTPAVASTGVRQPMFASVGVSASSRAMLSRNVRVVADPIFTFSKALLTKGPLNLNGNNVVVDSFDPGLAPGGIYNANYRNAKGNIATAQITNTLNVGNANVYGTVSTPHGGSVAVANNGAVGSIDWQNKGAGGIEPGWSRDDLNVTIDSAKLPAGFNPTLAPISNRSFTNVVTNYVAITNPPVRTYPTGYDLVITNTSDMTSSSYPTGVAFTGTVQTNTASTTTISLPTEGTYTGSITTNVLKTSSTTIPASGSYVGKVTTNVLSFTNQKDAPTDYVPGTLVISGGTKNPKYAYSQYQYVYFTITGYSFDLITGYTYHRIDSYTGISFSSPVLKTNVATYQYIFPAGDWIVDSISGNVLVTGNARVEVTSSISISGQSAITINPGASLILYMAGGTADFSGKGVVNNNADARTFSYVGLPSNTSIKLSGNAAFTGTFYAPQAQLQLSGGGNNTMDFVGAAVVDSVLMNGHFNLHYPENLSKGDPISGYVVKTWQEY